MHWALQHQSSVGILSRHNHRQGLARRPRSLYEDSRHHGPSRSALLTSALKSAFTEQAHSSTTFDVIGCMSTSDMVQEVKSGTELDCASKNHLHFSRQSRKKQTRAIYRQAGRLQMAGLCPRQDA